MREEDMIPRLSTEQLRQFIQQKESYIERSRNMPREAQMPFLTQYHELNLKKAKEELAKRD